MINIVIKYCCYVLINKNVLLFMIGFYYLVFCQFLHETLARYVKISYYIRQQKENFLKVYLKNFIFHFFVFDYYFP